MNKYLQDLLDAGGVEIEPRDWYLKTYAIDETLQKYAVATYTAVEITISPFKGRVKVIWLHSEDVDLSKISLGDVFHGVGLKNMSAEYSVEDNYTEINQYVFGEMKLENWDRGFPCLEASIVADGGLLADYFVFMVER